MTKTYDITTAMVLAEFISLEARKPFYRNTSCIKQYQYVVTDTEISVSYYKILDLNFFTGKGADISVRDITNNSAVHFPAVPFGVDIIKLLLGKRTAVKLTELNNENLQHISAGCDNLEGRKSFVERDVALYNDKNVVSLC